MIEINGIKWRGPKDFADTKETKVLAVQKRRNGTTDLYTLSSNGGEIGAYANAVLRSGSEFYWCPISEVSRALGIEGLFKSDNVKTEDHA